MSWLHLERGQVNELPLDLYQDGRDFMIRVDGLELMNSRWNRSEYALGQLAGSRIKSSHPRVLIGGLGLGFTLDSVIKNFPEQSEIVVGEQSADVLRWYRSYFKPAFFKSDESRVTFLNESVQALLREKYDAIILDVDNGPRALSGSENEYLYSAKGLAQLRDCLADAGHIYIWSSFESPEFIKVAVTSGLACEVVSIEVGHRDHAHFIFVLSPAPRVSQT